MTMTLPKLKIVEVPIEKVTPYARNANEHGPEQVAQLATSIKKYGFTNPVLLDFEGKLIAGHGRILAAESLGLKSVPAIYLGHLSPEDVMAYRLADNRIAANSTWNVEMLEAEMKLLRDLDYDVSILGFSEDELAGMEAGFEVQSLPRPEILFLDPSQGKQADVEDDEFEESTIDKVRTDIVLGDVFQIGPHRLVCGDSTEADAVGTLLGDVVPTLMVTDPPYGVSYDPEWRNEAARNSEDMGNRTLGAGATGKVANDDRADWTEAYSLFPGDVAYVWHAGKYSALVHDNLVTAGFETLYQIIWAKSHFAIGRGDYHWQHEPCWYVVRKGKKHNWQGARDQATVWNIQKPSSSETGHSTQKPVECMARPIRNNTAAGDICYDPFGGSGTSMVAAEELGRVCYMMELTPRYCQVIVNRMMQNFPYLDVFRNGEKYNGYTE